MARGSGDNLPRKRVDVPEPPGRKKGVLVETATHLALRCPECGELEVHRLSAFDVGGGERYAVKCACGAEKLVLSHRSGSKLAVQIPCLLCEYSHFLYFSRSEFWTTSLQKVFCPETGIEIAFLGPENDVREMARNAEDDLKALVADSDEEEYFDNPNVMYDILNHLHHLAEDNRLICPCKEGEVEVEVYPDRVELHCTNCHRWWSVKAAEEEDLAILNQQEILLADDGGSGTARNKRR